MTTEITTTDPFAVRKLCARVQQTTRNRDKRNQLAQAEGYADFAALEAKAREEAEAHVTPEEAKARTLAAKAAKAVEAAEEAARLAEAKAAQFAAVAQQARALRAVDKELEEWAGGLGATVEEVEAWLVAWLQNPRRDDLQVQANFYFADLGRLAHLGRLLPQAQAAVKASLAAAEAEAGQLQKL